VKFTYAPYVIAFCLLPTVALAQVNIGVSLPITGHASVLGKSAKDAIDMMPDHIGDLGIKFTILDDRADSPSAAANAAKFVSDNFDVLMGSGASPQSLAMVDVAAQSKTPMIALSSTRKLIEPMDEKRRWIFKPNPMDNIWATAFYDSLKKKGAKTISFLAFKDAVGDNLSAEVQKSIGPSGLTLVELVKYHESDETLAANLAKLVAAKPDAIIIAAPAIAALLPQTLLKKENYPGLIYQTNTVATAAFLREGGQTVDGTIVVTGPCNVYEELPDTNPIKAPCADFTSRYESLFGSGTRNPTAYQAYDAWRLLAVAIPIARKAAAPGTPEFRGALRGAIEQIKDLPANTGVITMSPTDHTGLDQRAAVIAQAQNGVWRLLP
jgi:branched-chain amino acid transport system substrate-binding protein